MIGNIKVASTNACALIDPRATHSFISSKFVRMANIMPTPLDYKLCVSIPNGSVIMVSLMCPSCNICIKDHDLVFDLMVLEMRDFDIILRMDWLASYHAMMDCFVKKEIF